MKRTKKIIAIVTLLIMVVVMAVGCGNTATSKEPVELYIYNSKGENAEQFQAMCEAFTAETGIPTKAFSIGSGQDHTATLNAEMASENPPAIFSVQGLKELVTWEEGGFVLDFNNASNAEFKALADAIPQGLRLNSDGKANYGVPYNVEGYGYIVDSQMIADLFGADSADALLADLRACGYADFEAFVKAVDAP